MHAWLHGLRAKGPVVEVPFAGRSAWLIVDHAALRAAFRDEATFPAGEHYRRAIEPSQGRTFQGVDGPEHHVLRTLATPAFRPRALRSFEDELRPLAHELVDRFAAAGRADLVADFTRTYPFLVITRMLGIPREREVAFHGWAEAMLQQRGIPGVRVLMGLVSLTNKHTDTAIEEACRVAQTHGVYRLRVIRELLKRQAPEQEQFEFIAQHPLIRSLSDYGQLVHHAFEEVHA